MDKVVTVLRVSLGVLFIYASLDKLLQPVAFSEMIMGYRLVPVSLVTLAATVLPWLELLVGGCLIIGFLHRSAATWATGFGLVFLLAKISVILRGLDVSCGCFSVNGGSSITWSDIPANLVLFLVALVVLLKGPDKFALERTLVCQSTTASQ
ncbi:MAG: MauE/DoxX family redox-associated membrane protein [Vulcanimicrobiota bacterium]